MKSCKEMSYLFIKLEKKRQKQNNKKKTLLIMQAFFFFFFFCLQTEANVKLATSREQLFLFNLINMLRHFETISLLWGREDINNVRDARVVRSHGTGFIQHLCNRRGMQFSIQKYMYLLRCQCEKKIKSEFKEVTLWKLF